MLQKKIEKSLLFISLSVSCLGLGFDTFHDSTFK
jgi:hypothetical protein